MNIKKIGGMLIGLTMRRFIMSAILHFILILPYKYLFAIIPGNEAKTAAFLPAVLGLLWGPAGAVGVAAANFMGDLFAGHLLYTAVTGGAANFFQAYIPYKLWYTFQADARAPYFLCDGKSVVKYIYILFLTSLSTNAMTAMAGVSSNLFSGSAMFIRGFADQFEASVVFGIPLLILFSGKNVQPCLPKTRMRPTKGGSPVPYDGLPYLVVLIGAAYSLIAEEIGIVVHPVAAFLCWVVMFLLLCLFMLKPVYNWNAVGNIVEPVRHPLFARVVLAFAMIGCVTAGVIGYMFYGLVQKNMLVHDLHTWRYLYESLGWAVQVVFGVFLFFLWRIERTIVRPVRTLIGVARSQSLAGGRLNVEELTGGSREPSDEIQQLTSALLEMNFGLNGPPIMAAVDCGHLKEALNKARIQRIFLPNSGLFRSAEGDFGVRALLCQGQGGHYGCYDFFIINEKRLLVCVIDIMGESQPLLYMALIKALMRNLAREESAPEELLTCLNAELYVGDDASVSAFIGIAELGGGKISCASAGNIALAVCRSGKKAEWAKIPSGEALLVRRDSHYDSFQILLGENDSLFVCANVGGSDGAETVQAALNQCRDEKFSEDELLEVIAQRSGRKLRTGDLAMLLLRRARVRKNKLFMLRRG